MKSINGKRGQSCGRQRSAAISIRRFVSCRATDGVESLLARDRKPIQVASELEVKISDEVKSGVDKVPVDENKVVKSRESRRKAQQRAASDVENAGPKRTKEAIDEGISLFNQKKHEEAIKMFNLALELPGNGAYRLSGSIREFSCPSDAEEQAALYNLACCYCALGKKQAALACIEGIVEQGFKDFGTIRTDPDLISLRGAELEACLIKGQAANAFSFFAGKKDSDMVSDPNKKKSWLQW